MRKSAFWRIMAVCFLFALLYVGHGMHRNDAVSGGGSGIVLNNGNGAGWNIMTASPDGRSMYAWKVDGGRPGFLGKAMVTDE